MENLPEIEPHTIKGFIPLVYWVIGILSMALAALAGRMLYNYEDRVKILEDKVGDLVDEKLQYVTRAEFMSQVEKFEKKMEDIGKDAQNHSARVEAKIDGLILFLMQRGQD